MKAFGKFPRTLVALCALGVAAGGAYYLFFYESEKPVDYRTAAVEKRDIRLTIDATGTVEPEDLVNVGARVSGEIISFGKDKNGKEVDYGSEISEGAVLALIDDEIQKSNLLQAEANLEKARASQKQAQANLTVAEANLRQAERNWKRAKSIGVSEALSQASYDTYLSAWESAVAQIEVAKAQILQADATVVSNEADVKLARRNLSYCVIKAPVDGVVIDRIVSVGQTVVSSMNASSLFLIAKDLKKMEVWASVNEADIAKIYAGQEVEFTVDAYSGEKFRGKVNRVRLNATMSQNVVTYIVEVSTDNSDGKLLPYLTANLSFIVENRTGVLAVPTSALRWSPAPSMIAEGFSAQSPKGKRLLWVLADGGKVRPIAVETGLNDGAYVQVSSPEISEGTNVVVGGEIAVAKKASADNPFMPKMPKRKRP